MPVTLCYNETARIFYTIENGRGSKEDNFCMSCPTLEYAERVSVMIDKALIIDKGKRQVHLYEVRRICRHLELFLEWAQKKQSVLF